MAENAALFLAYGSFQNVVRTFSGRPSGEDLSLSQLGVAAAGAGFLTSFIMFVHFLDHD
jgi:mitochondrial ornithine carrier protein